MSWVVRNDRIVLDTPWLRVREQSCETASGGVIMPYYVIDCADWVMALATTEANDLVLVRQYRHACGTETLEFPAGEMAAGEDPVAAARRELAEETGYTGGSAAYLRAVSPNPSRYTNRLHFVLIEGVTQDGFPKSDAVELTVPHLWPRDRAQMLVQEASFLNADCGYALAVLLGLPNQSSRPVSV